MKLSARNQLKGTITEIQEGAVNGIVKIDIGGVKIIKRRRFRREYSLF